MTNCHTRDSACCRIGCAVISRPFLPSPEAAAAFGVDGPLSAHPLMHRYWDAELGAALRWRWVTATARVRRCHWPHGLQSSGRSRQASWRLPRHAPPPGEISGSTGFPVSDAVFPGRAGEDPPPERAAALELVSESEGMTVPRKSRPFRPFVEGRGRRQGCWGAFPGNVGPLGTVVVIRVVGKGPDGVTHRTVTGCTDVAPGAPRSLQGVCSCWGMSSEGHAVGDVPESHAGVNAKTQGLTVLWKCKRTREVGTERHGRSRTPLAR